MDEVLRPFQHLKIQMKEIMTATNNFDDENNYIGGGGFGGVYKGELSHSKGRSQVAIKRLDRTNDQGDPEFLKEITTLCRYKHENLISLLGFCYHEDEAILVYELASHGSLEKHLDSAHLTWSQRLNICLGAAKGLRHLHDPKETHQRLIHCDVKSANILLDDYWDAKVADFGFSVMGPANEQQSTVIHLAAGTLGYCDPQYAMTHTLTKESDVYSFGVVLFEVLCGTVCCTYSNGRFWSIVSTWIESYEENKLNDIIFKNPNIQPMDQISLETISGIAYQCLNKSRKDRPKMTEVVAELETALERQEFSEGKSPPFFYEELARTTEPQLKHYKSETVLKLILSKGVFLKGCKTWFSLNTKGEHCELISCGECVVPSVSENYPWSSGYNSRFAVGTYHSVNGRFKARVKSQFLSPQIIYTVNLVFKFTVPVNANRCHLIAIKYKLQGETKTSTSYLAREREDGWWLAELYQFPNYKKNVDLEILFIGYQSRYSVIEVEGIEFRPLENEDEKLDTQTVSNTDANWEEKLPTDYEGILKCSKNRIQWTTMKEVYSIFRRGFLINDGLGWFTLDINGKKCHMLSARVGNCIEGEIAPYWQPLPKSRFGRVVKLMDRQFNIITEINYKLVSSQTTYATYLVYKLPRDQSRYEAPVEVSDEELGSYWYIYLRNPQTPVITQTRFIRPNAAQNTHNPVNRPKIKGLPQQRDDGWMEVQIWEFRTGTTTEMIPMHLKLTACGTEALSGLTIEGIEFVAI